MQKINFKPSKDQQSVIDSPDSVCVLAGPGTGKSITAIATARKSLSILRPRQNVLFISLSNAAINRLAKDAGIECDGLKNLKFLTYHSLAWDIVKSYGRHIGLPVKISVMDEVERAILEVEGFPVQETASYEDMVKVAMDTGKISFGLMVPLAIQILSKISKFREIESARFPLIIADEFQDTREDQWELLKLIGGTSRIIILGDLNQNIYKDTFESAKGRVDEFIRWKNAKRLEFSHKSFRCKNSEVLDFSQAVLEGKKFEQRDSKNISIRACYSNALRAEVAAHCLRIFDKFPEKKIGILTPSAASAQKLALELKIPPESSKVSAPIHTRIPLSEKARDSFRCACVAMFQLKKNKTPASLKSAAQALVAMRYAFSSKVTRSPENVGEIIKQISERPPTKKSKRPLYDLVNSTIEMTIEEFEKLFIQKLLEIKIFETPANQINLMGFSLINPSLALSSQMEFPFDHYRDNREQKGLYGETYFQSKVEVLSIWKSKGREFDFVIMFMDSVLLPDKIGEETERRLLYVASTRAKEWLGVLYQGNRPGRALYKVVRSD